MKIKICGLILLLMGFNPVSFLFAQEALIELARPGPWAGVSGLISYHSKIYLVNSQIFVNHNSADIYSYSPEEKHLQFEHRLFSQDAGDPVVMEGLLYWPYEDPRFSASQGEFEITDGQQWQWRAIPEIYGFHVHTLGHHKGIMYALASAWKGRIYRSLDQGQQWELMYEHPTPPGKVSRLTAMVSLGERLYFALTARAEEGSKLLFSENTSVLPVPGWPRGRALGALTAFREKIYAVNYTKNGNRLWRSDGKQGAEAIEALDGFRIYDLAATANRLWAVGKKGKRGALWQSDNGMVWKESQSFLETPIAVATIEGQIYVGTYNEDRGGSLWGPAHPSKLKSVVGKRKIPTQPVRFVDPLYLQKALQEFDELLTNQLDRELWRQMRTIAISLALSRDPAVGEALVSRLNGPFPQRTIPMFGGIRISAERLIQWYLLYAIGLNGHGRIPPELITRPWQASSNRAEKYLEPSVAAAWAVGQLNQSDPTTLNALKGALQGDLPQWAKKDISAALHTLGDSSYWDH